MAKEIVFNILNNLYASMGASGTDEGIGATPTTTREATGNKFSLVTLTFS